MGKSIGSVVVLLAFSLVHQSVQLSIGIPGTSVTFTPDSSRDAVCGSDIREFTAYLYGDAPDVCEDPIVTTAQWNNFKAGWVVSPGTSAYDLKDNYANCKAVNPTAPQSEDAQEALCEYTLSVAEAASFCASLSCYNGVFNRGLSSSCSTLGQRICLAFQPAVSDLVNYAIATGRSDSDLPSGYTYNRALVTVPTSCNPSDCRAADVQQSIGIPDTSLTFTPDSSRDAVCGSDIREFTSYFYGDPPNVCKTPIVTTAQWTNFKAGWVVSPGTSVYDLKDNYYNCKAVTPTAPQTQDAQEALCEYTLSVAEAASFCGTLSCYTDVFNRGLSSACSTLGQRICEAFQPALSDLVNHAITAGRSDSDLPSGYTYDRARVTVPPSCNPSDCRAAASLPGAPGPNVPGGAAGTSLVVLAVVFGLALSLL